MQLAGHGFVYHFPDDFDDRAAVEMTDKEYVAGGAVELPGRGRYPVAFFTPTRLRQELALMTQQGEAVLTEPGLAVIAEVTPDAILRAVPELIRQGFFDHLKPLTAPLVNGASGPATVSSAVGR